MDLSPYLQLLLDKSADNLLLIADTPPSLRLDDQSKTVGKTPVSAEFINQFINELFNNAQKNDINNFKIASSPYQLIGSSFTAHAEKTISGIEVFITTDNKGLNLDTSNIQVLGGIPATFEVMPYLIEMAKLEGSDIFLTVDSPVKIKISGQIIPMDSFLLSPEFTKTAALSIMTEDQQSQFLLNKDLDFAIALPDNSARFRVNAFFQRQSIGLVFRLIPSDIPKPESLGLPNVLLEQVLAKRGLLLVVGGTGSGKSTSLASMINHRNENSVGHIVTIEDPIEYSHPNLQSIINQREVGIDTASYATALRACLREAPNVILIGEIRDKETMKAALELANTGHLCISTMHSNNANQAIERIVNMFPNIEHKQLFMDLSVNLNAVISQRLIPTPEGSLCAAFEVLVNTPHISNLILTGQLNEIKEAMSTSGGKGVKIFDDSLLELYKRKKISLEEALKNADSRNDLEAKINFG